MRDVYYLLLFLLVYIGLVVFLYIRYKKKVKNIKVDKAEEIKAYAEKQNEQVLNEYDENVRKNELLSAQIKEKQTFNSSLQKVREEELDLILQKEKEKKTNEIKREVEEWAKSAQEIATLEYESVVDSYNKSLEETYEKLRNLYMEVNEYKEARDAINAEILRQRAINENQDFYRIQIDEESKHDIEVINSIRSQIFKFEILNKLLYDNYVSKPAKEMVKRVLEGKNPSGIYKVTNIETQEIYIGKSTTVADRWINHIKSACGLAGVADSQFQRALKKYGVDSFTWELLEEVPKDKLTEKEKYYINFYDTTHYGYNMRMG